MKKLFEGSPVVISSSVDAPNEKSLKEQIIDHTIKFSLGTTLRGVGQFINQYSAAFLLGPAVFGIWQGVKLVLSYGSLTGLGSIAGMTREVPILRGRKEENEIIKVKDVSFLFNFFTTIFLSIIVFAITFIFKFDSVTILSLRFVAFILLFQFSKSFLEAWLKANNKFDIISRMAVIEGAGAAAAVILIFFFSFPGFLAGFAMSLLLSAIYGYLKSGFTIQVKWDLKLLKSLIKIGFPIMLLGLSDVLFYTVDRLLILKFLDTKSLGFYSLGFLVFAPAMFIFSSSSSVMYPRFAERFGSTRSDKDLKNLIIMPIKVLSLAAAFVIGAIAIAMPIMVRIFLPTYTQGIASANILIFGLFFSYSAGMVANFFLATKRLYVYLISSLAVVFINFILSFMLLKSGWGIIGVSMGTSLSYFVLFLILSSLAVHYCKMKGRESAMFFLEVLLPIVYVFIVSSLIIEFLSAHTYSSLVLMENMVLKEIVYLVFASILVYFLFKNSEIKKYFFYNLKHLIKNEKI